MLSGLFKNCYGIRSLDMKPIYFDKCNRAVIYAPNGAMKTSFAKVFEDISLGNRTEDRIYDCETCYSVQYTDKNFTFSSTAQSGNLEKAESVYVINSFIDKFEFTNETVGTLLADEETRNAYNTISETISSLVQYLETSLASLSGVSRTKIKNALINDFEISSSSDWTEIIEEVRKEMSTTTAYSFWGKVKYSDIFNEKTLAVLEEAGFQASIKDYIDSLNALLEKSEVLTSEFTDRSAENLGKALRENDLFKANHTIHLSDGRTVIRNYTEWSAIITNELDKIYREPRLNAEFSRLKNMLSRNAELRNLRDALVSCRDIIPLLSNVGALKKSAWISLFGQLDRPFKGLHHEVSEYVHEVRRLYAKASEQSERWEEVVTEFNRRFRVPFRAEIRNRANVLLRDEAPNIVFPYITKDREDVELDKDKLMQSLSRGEKRALYLLYILFDLEKMRKQASEGKNRFLIIADDIADSFDYKNKYAIIEYLNDICQQVNGIDLLVLTHNYDFYRSVMLRLGICRSNCMIAQRSLDGKITISEFKYQRDFFKNVFIANLVSRNTSEDDLISYLFASIPFYRNLSEYMNDPLRFKKLTCFLHLKSTPISTEEAKVSDLIEELKEYLPELRAARDNELYLHEIFRISDNIVASETDEISLHNKLILSIAIRLKAEKLLQKAIVDVGENCPESEGNQTREWFEKAKQILNNRMKEVIEDVLLITPESIHVNSFMYEPIIDISDWSFKDLYNRLGDLCDM